MNRSVLTHGATPEGEAPFVPWFADSDKLLAAVVVRAAHDREFARRVVDEIGNLARERRMLKRLLNAAKGGRRGAPRRELWVLAMVADTFQHMRSAKPYGASARCQRWIAETSVFNVTSPEGAEKLLKAARSRFPNGAMPP